MNARVNYALVGLFVLMLGVALVGGVVWLTVGDTTVAYERYRVYIEGSVTGLNEGASVKYRGVNVGRVESIGIDPDRPDRVALRLAVQEETPINSDTVARLESIGVTGVYHINLAGTSEAGTPLTKPPGEPYPVIDSRPSLWGRLDQTLTEVSGRLIETADRVNALLDEDNRLAIGTILANMATVTGVLAARRDVLDAAIEDAAATLANARAASEPLPALTEDAAAAIARLDTLLQELDAAATALRKTATSGQGAVQRFGRETLPAVEGLLQELQRAAENLERFSNQVAQEPSTLLYGGGAPRPGPGE